MITFNILYIPGTVASLRPFPGSLARWSQTGVAGQANRAYQTCCFRLVSNGCLEEERRILQELCTTEPSFEYLELSRDQVLPHGVALAELQRRETSNTFAFIDSDVFATGPWLGSAQEEFLRRDAVFSCPPVWSDLQFEIMPLDHRILGGAFLHLEDGRCIGNSYFGIYDNRLLKETIARHGVSFQRVHWEQLPAPLKGLLEAKGLPMQILDTGRLLNLLLGFDGRDLAFLPLPGLGHIGGVSGLRVTDAKAVPSRALRRLRRALGGIRRRLRKPEGKPVSAPERALNQRKARCRRATVAYFTGLLEALSQGRPHNGQASLQELAREEPALVERIRGLEAQIRTLDEVALPGRGLGQRHGASRG